MSCADCDKRNEGQKGIAYYRWKNANIAMMGCDKHLREIFDTLSTAQFDAEIADITEVPECQSKD